MPWLRRRPAGDSPLRHRDFALYVAATVATSFAIEMSFVAIGWQVYAIHRDPLDLGIVGLAMFLPLPLLALPAGHLSDRYPRRTVLALSLALDAAVSIGLLAVTRAGANETWPFFALAFVTGVASAVGSPAGRAMTPSLVPQEILVKAFAQRSVASQLSVIAGPALGGLLFALDPELVYVVASVFSLVSLAAVLAMHAGRDGAGAGSPDLASVLGGVRLVRRTQVLLGAISLDLFAVLFGGAVALLPAIAEDRLGVGAVGFGWLRAAVGIGAGAVTLFLARRPITRRVGRTLLLAVAVFGIGTIVLGLTRSYVVAFGALLLLAGADALSVFIRSTLVPLVTPRATRGRVLAVETVFIGASNELGAFESGVAGQLLGPAAAVALGGVATIAIAGLWWTLFPALRKVDRFPQAPEEVGVVIDEDRAGGAAPLAGGRRPA